MAGSFADRLRAGPPVVADGGMGVVLSEAVPGLRCPEEANLRAPDAVTAVHVSFINAGAELIETNTFGANRHKLAQHFLEDDFERINSAGVKLARDAREITGREVFIGREALGIYLQRFAPALMARLARKMAAPGDR